MALHDTTLPQWSPDGASLAYAGTGSDTNDVFVVDARTGVCANLGRPGAADEKPVWSPDGSEVAFESDRSGRRGVYAARPDGSGVRLVPCCCRLRVSAEPTRPRWPAMYILSVLFIGEVKCSCPSSEQRALRMALSHGVNPFSGRQRGGGH